MRCPVCFVVMIETNKIRFKRFVRTSHNCNNLTCSWVALALRRRIMCHGGTLCAMGANSTLVTTVTPCIDELVVAIYADNFAVICAFLTNHLARRKINIVDVERKWLSLRLRSISARRAAPNAPIRCPSGSTNTSSPRVSQKNEQAPHSCSRHLEKR